jgi:glycosyltransferase involved in cell wall biosynthesis
LTKITTLSLFFPAYNDAPALPRLIEQAFRYASECAESFEVIVINDASQDDTDRVLEALCSRFGPRLSVVRHAKNRGYGGALRSGFRASTKEFVFYTDGDAQYDMADLPKLVEKMTPGVGLVNGYKISRSDAWYRVLLGETYLFVVRHLFWLKIRDVDCDFRLIRRSALRNLALTTDSGAICVELVRKIQDTGCDIVQVPVRHLPRLHGSSQFFRFRNLWRMVVDLLLLFASRILSRASVPQRQSATDPVQPGERLE